VTSFGNLKKKKDQWTSQYFFTSPTSDLQHNMKPIKLTPDPECKELQFLERGGRVFFGFFEQVKNWQLFS